MRVTKVAFVTYLGGMIFFCFFMMITVVVPKFIESASQLADYYGIHSVSSFFKIVFS